jgi:hypothetical protein
MSTGLEWLTPVAVMPYIGDMELRRAEPPGTSQAPQPFFVSASRKPDAPSGFFARRSISV